MATVPAILGTARLGNFRLGYQPAAVAAVRATRVRIYLDGVLATSRVRVAGLSIHDVLNDAPNTCSLTIEGTPAPVSGMALRITINSDTPRLLFSGTIQTDDQTYEGRPTQLCYPCRAIDDTARLNTRLPFGLWTNVSATTVAQELIAEFAPGFTSTHVEAGLPVVTVAFDGTEGFTGALRQIAKLIGGYFYVEDRDLHLFLTEATDAPDDLDSTPSRFLDDPPIQASSDDSQLRTRLYGRGHAAETLIAVAIGETIVPVSDVVMFNTAGGRAIASTTSDGSPTEIVQYTGVMLGGGGSLIGPGQSPSAVLTATRAAGTGVTAGTHLYAYTWVTAAGETLPSPTVSLTTGVLDPPTGAIPYSLPAGGGSLDPNAWYGLAYTWVTAAGETTSGPRLVAVTDTVNKGLQYFPIPLGPTGTTDRKLYRTEGQTSSALASTAQLKFLVTVAGNVSTAGHTDLAADAALGANVPTSNTATAEQVTIAGVALGPAGTTSRKVYRTAAGAGQLKLQQTIANNTATTGVTDATADGALGANVPIANTSGLSAVAAAGGGFVTASPVTFQTNGAATAANTASPVFTSVTYVFVAADVGASVYIKAGTNWTVGSYRIVSVAAGAATVAGPMASVASPTGATWGVDYSAFTTPRYLYTDLVIDGTTATKVTSAAQPFGMNSIGNTLTLTSGVGFAGQSVVVLSISGVTATCDKVLGTLSSTGGQGVLGVAPIQPFVSAGSTTIATASTGAFASTGGWVRIAGSDALVRYTGISGNTLTGVPASGTGALLTTVPYNTLLESVPALSGVTGVVAAWQQGSRVHIWVQRDDAAAQAAAAARETTDDYTSDGIHEHLLVDERRGEASLTALCDADLALFADPIVTVSYATRDVKTKSGKPIVVTLSSPAISETLTIQDVTITEIDIAPGLAPRFTASASSVRFSLEDMLRRLSGLVPE